jgi:epsilon-lactone hydrolase
MSLQGFFLKQFLSLTKNIFSLDSVPKELSRDILEGFSNLSPDPPDIVIKREDIGEVECFWVWDGSLEPIRTVVYFHGGGYHFGSAYTHRRLAYRISQEANAKILIINYRKAPQFRFPAPIKDCISVYHALLDEGLDITSTVFGGDSAGGGLALSCLLKIRELELLMPRAVFLLSPWVDLECRGRSLERNELLDPWLNKKLITEFAKSYLGDASPSNVLASPLNADLSGFPPTLVQVGTHEVLYDDALRLSFKLKEAGVDSRLSTWKKMIHVFQAFDRFFKESDVALREIGQFVKDKTGIHF